MSWAQVAKGPVPEELQGKPDPSLLTTAAPDRAPSPSGDLDQAKDHVAVVDHDALEKLKNQVEHADDVPAEDEFAAARRHKEARDAEEQQARLKAQAQAELKESVDKVEAVGETVTDKGEEALDKAEKKGKEILGEAEKEGKKLASEAKAKGKELEKDAKEAWKEGKKEAKEFADKAEKVGKEEAKKLQKKASEVEKEGRALAKRYPYAATGIVGFVNFALLAVPAFYAYQNWHLPRWDRRIVSAVAVGLTAVFGAESALGYFEVQQEKKGKWD
ncbi:hypothetical protein JCM8547_008269 [Rhodosporidiobolus lusitaniae]